MGDSPVRQSFLPAVRVTAADRREYASIVDESLRETLALYEDFAFKRHRRMDHRRWKLLRAKETARVYRERSGSDRSASESASASAPSPALPLGTCTPVSSGHAESPSASGSTGSDEPETFAGADEPVPMLASHSSVEIGPGSSLSVSTKIPVLVTTRHMPGELDDVMYGVFASDAASHLRRGLHEKEGMTDAVVLATLDAPGETRPFHSLQVVWMLRAFPGVGAALVRRRDFLLLVSSGTTVSQATGERLGFGIAQSVAHPDLPELREQQIVRGVMSYCAIFRQLPNQQVEAFIQVVIDPRGAAMTFFIVQETVSSLLGLSNPVDSAIRKKLAWFVRQARERRRRDAHKRTAKPNGSSSASPPLNGGSVVQTGAALLADASLASSSSSTSIDRTCAHCTKPLGALLGPQGQRCSICHHWACSKCRVVKSLAVRVSGGNTKSTMMPFVAQPFTFCLPCFVAAKKYPAVQLQLEELRRSASDSVGSSRGGGRVVGDSLEDGVTLYRLTEV